MSKSMKEQFDDLENLADLQSEEEPTAEITEDTDDTEGFVEEVERAEEYYNFAVADEDLMEDEFTAQSLESSVHKAIAQNMQYQIARQNVWIEDNLLMGVGDDGMPAKLEIDQLTDNQQLALVNALDRIERMTYIREEAQAKYHDCAYRPKGGQPQPIYFRTDAEVEAQVRKSEAEKADKDAEAKNRLRGTTSAAIAARMAKLAGNKDAA